VIVRQTIVDSIAISAKNSLPMTSSFTWLDYSEQDKRKMLDVISLFSEKTTRDELGIGSVRDAFANLFFPGTSVIQTRARYFLFIPWIYLDLVSRKTASNQIASKLGQKEVELINALAASGETKGVIGIQARASLKRLPSNIYWYGLGAWGIRHFPGSQDEYHRSLDHLYHLASRTQRNDDGEPVDGKITYNWHRELPPVPLNFPQNVTFRLTLAEAQYLAERIITQHPHSLLAFLVDRRQLSSATTFAWEHPLFDQFPDHIQQQLHHAHNFSETMQGAALLYNLMLAEQKQAEELTEQYQQALQDWAVQLSVRQNNLRQWDRQKFWEIVAAGGAQVSLRTQGFIQHWLNLALNLDVAQTIATHPEARSRIQEREALLKGGQARLSNPRALELWQGDSGTAPLDYRWGAVQRILNDILNGLIQENADVAA
jgi:hypothetical protein